MIHSSNHNTTTPLWQRLISQRPENNGRRSNPRVLLLPNWLPRPPSRARLVKHLPALRVHLDLRLALDKLERQTLAGVPRDMAVHQPRARVVELECDREIAVARQRRHVAPRRVGRVELAGVAVKKARRLCEDPKVVSVEVDGVGQSG